ncbi:hypothetical protein ACFL02_01075 [Planctomycetota bacterium]
MRPKDNIEKLVRRLRYKAGAETHKRVLGDIMQIFAETKKTISAETQPNTGRIIMRNRITRYVAAAVVIVAVITGIYMFSGSAGDSGVVWADVVKKISQTDSFIHKGKTIYNNGPENDVDSLPPPSSSTTYVSSKYGFKSEIYINDILNLISYTLFQEKKMYYIFPIEKEYQYKSHSEVVFRSLIQENDVKNTIKKFFSFEHKNIGRDIIDGIYVEGIEINDPIFMFDTGYSPDSPFIARLWVDEDTNLPVRIKFEYVLPGFDYIVNTVYTEFQWGVKLDKNDFTPNITDDYTLREDK